MSDLLAESIKNNKENLTDEELQFLNENYGIEFNSYEWVGSELRDSNNQEVDAKVLKKVGFVLIVFSANW